MLFIFLISNVVVFLNKYFFLKKISDECQAGVEPLDHGRLAFTILSLLFPSKRTNGTKSHISPFLGVTLHQPCLLFNPIYTWSDYSVTILLKLFI